MDGSFIEDNRKILFNKVSSYLIVNNSDFRLMNIEQQYFNDAMNDNNILLSLGKINTIYNEFKNVIEEFNEEVKKKKNHIDFTKMFPPDSIATLKQNFIDNFLSEVKEVATKNSIDDQEDDLTSYFNEILNARNAVTEAIINDVLLNFSQSFTSINANYPSTPSERAKNYVFADVGYGYAFSDLQTQFVFTGVSIYMRPINTSIPLSDYNDSFGRLFYSRFSFLIGINLTGNIDEPNERESFLGSNKTVLLGAGFRLFPGLKLNGGYVVYHEYSSPLVTKPKLGGSPFISLSLDFGITPIFKDAFSKTSAY